MPSDIANDIESGRLTGQALEQAKRYWASNETLNGYYAKTRTRFVAAMGKLVNNLSDGDADLNRKIHNGGIEPVLMIVKKIDRRR